MSTRVVLVSHDSASSAGIDTARKHLIAMDHDSMIGVNLATLMEMVPFDEPGSHDGSQTVVRAIHAVMTEESIALNLGCIATEGQPGSFRGITKLMAMFAVIGMGAVGQLLAAGWTPPDAGGEGSDGGGA